MKEVWIQVDFLLKDLKPRETHVLEEEYQEERRRWKKKYPAQLIHHQPEVNRRDL